MGYKDMNIESNSKYIKAAPGKPITVHIVTKEPKENLIHWVNKKREICRGKGCNWCQSLDPKEKQKQTWSTNVIDRADGKLKSFEFGPMIAEQIRNYASMLAEKGDTVHDYDYRIMATDDKGFTKYTVMQLNKEPGEVQYHETFIENPEDNVPF
jgi:hypothetical protein